ncbi:MAG: DUF4258 domain-containing protein [Deltaproteobacteria bacterium]|nr:DUF4258 domain-containing protein [Deltaproteobacteria bacterium]
MDTCSATLDLVRGAALRRILFLPHAVRQMSRPDRMISSDEIRTVIVAGELVEDYPDDPRGHSCLLLGHGTEHRPIHVVCAPRTDYVAIITAYLPASDEWDEGFRVRRQS